MKRWCILCHMRDRRHSSCWARHRPLQVCAKCRHEGPPFHVHRRGGLPSGYRRAWRFMTTLHSTQQQRCLRQALNLHLSPSDRSLTPLHQHLGARTCRTSTVGDGRAISKKQRICVILLIIRKKWESKNGKRHLRLVSQRTWRITRIRRWLILPPKGTPPSSPLWRNPPGLTSKCGPSPDEPDILATKPTTERHRGVTGTRKGFCASPHLGSSIPWFFLPSY